MKRFKTLGIGLLTTFSATMHAGEITTISCWDSTFAYNYADISKTDNGFEISVKGSGYLSERNEPRDLIVPTMLNGIQGALGPSSFGH